MEVVPAIQINPDAIYTEGTIALTLGVTLATLSKARSRGELQYVRRGRRVFIRGRDLLAWLEPIGSRGGKDNAG
jgi:excisionase family DNA binding protein